MTDQQAKFAARAEQLRTRARSIMLTNKSEAEELLDLAAWFEWRAGEEEAFQQACLCTSCGVQS